MPSSIISSPYWEAIIHTDRVSRRWLKYFTIASSMTPVQHGQRHVRLHQVWIDGCLLSLTSSGRFLLKFHSGFSKLRRYGSSITHNHSPYSRVKEQESIVFGLCCFPGNSCGLAALSSHHGFKTHFIAQALIPKVDFCDDIGFVVYPVTNPSLSA